MQKTTAVAEVVHSGQIRMSAEVANKQGMTVLKRPNRSARKAGPTRPKVEEALMIGSK